MTQEEKELLIKDLCSRLPYECIVSIAEGGIDGIKWADLTLNSYLFYQIMEEDAWEYVKPYLRRVPSMTENENDEWRGYWLDSLFKSTEIKYPESQKYLALSHSKSIEWLNKHHFDYNGLIDMGLALEAKPDMYKIIK